MIATVNKNDLVAFDFSDGTSKRIIRQGKELLIEREVSEFTKTNVLAQFLLLSLLNYLALMSRTAHFLGDKLWRLEKAKTVVGL